VNERDQKEKVVREKQNETQQHILKDNNIDLKTSMDKNLSFDLSSTFLTLSEERVRVLSSLLALLEVVISEVGSPRFASLNLLHGSCFICTFGTRPTDKSFDLSPG
jgi:hypothetical protein